MKNYPLLTSPTGEPWYNWHKTIILPLDRKIRALYDYSNYFIPDFYQQNLSEVSVYTYKDFNETDTFYVDDFVTYANQCYKTITQHTGVWNDNDFELQEARQIDSRKLDFHGYVLILQTSYDQNTETTLSPGSLLVSLARNEGELDANKGGLKDKKKYYFAQPAGWASFYTANFYNQKMVFNYDRYAEETNGRTLLFTLNDGNCRFFHSKHLETSQGSYVFTNVKDVSVSELINNKENWLIYDRNYTLWTDTKYNPLMSLMYWTDSNQNNDYGEEIVIDYQWKTDTKIAKTNIAEYIIAWSNRDADTSNPLLPKAQTITAELF